MANKYLLDRNGTHLMENNNLNLIVYSSDRTKGDVILEIVRAVKSRNIHPVFKLYLLNYDETIKEDVSDYLLDGGSMTVTFQNGIRRNMNVTLDNSSKIWNPNPQSGYLWADSKFRLDIGVLVEGGELWYQAGIFVPNDPSLSNTPDGKTVSLQLSDKFASLDGSAGGKLSSTTEIPVGSNIKDAYSGLLTSNRVRNTPYDVKPLRFPRRYLDEATAYTITKTDETTIGEIGIELAEMLSCDIFYDNFGYLCFKEGDYTLETSDSEIVWEFDENDMEYIDDSIDVTLSEVHNVVTVIGANINGDLVSYTAQNKNPKSPTNIWSLEPNTLRITDENIYSDDLARQRAEYELFKQGLLPLSFKARCTFLPHLDVDKIVKVSNDFYGFKDTPFLIQSIDIPLSQSDNDITLTMLNISEVTLSNV